MQSGLQRYQEKMARATELRQKQTEGVKDRMDKLVGHVEEKREFKHVMVENDYMAEFRKNVEKREKMEEKKKKLAEAKNYDKDQDREKKELHWEEIKGRQDDNRIKLQKRNASLEKRWQHIKDRGNNMTNGQAAFYEKRMADMENTNRRMWIQ